MSRFPKDHAALTGMLAAVGFAGGTWLQGRAVGILPTADFMMLALAAQFHAYGARTFAMHGDVGGLLALAICLSLLVFVGATGGVIALAILLTLWLAFPRDIRPRYWLHTYLPIVLPAMLMVVASMTLGRATGAGFLDIAQPLTVDRPVTAAAVLGLSIAGLTGLGALSLHRHRAGLAGAYFALGAALACASAVVVLPASLGLVSAVAWYAGFLVAGLALLGVGQRLAEVPAA